MTDLTDHPPVLPGAEPLSHDGDRRGALVLHGFTGCPMSMRPLGEAFAAAGWSVEMPRLPGHGTTVEDMDRYTWSDWTAAADAAYDALAARTDAVVVVGLSMGGALTVHVAAGHEVAGIVTINAAVEHADFAPLADQLAGALAAGNRIVPGVGNDVADPAVTELAYPAMPVEGLMSFAAGMPALKAALPSITVPALVIHSVQDHVVPVGSHTALVEGLGGEVEVLELERSYHVATIDYDSELIVERTLAFASRVVDAVG